MISPAVLSRSSVARPARKLSLSRFSGSAAAMFSQEAEIEKTRSWKADLMRDGSAI